MACKMSSMAMDLLPLTHPTLWALLLFFLLITVLKSIVFQPGLVDLILMAAMTHLAWSKFFAPFNVATSDFLLSSIHVDYFIQLLHFSFSHLGIVLHFNRVYRSLIHVCFICTFRLYLNHDKCAVCQFSSLCNTAMSKCSLFHMLYRSRLGFPAKWKWSTLITKMSVKVPNQLTN